jgi:hypothetical protein
MANKFKGEVSFDAGDEKYVLRFSADALVSIEEAFDKTMKQVGEMMRDPETLRMSTVKRIFCIGLVDHYMEDRPEIDAAKAATIFRRLRPIDATEIMNRAFVAAFDRSEGEAGQSDQNPPKPGEPNGTGPDSTATG